MIHHTHPQGSPEWLAARKGVITGSRFKDARDRLADKPEKVDKKTGEVTPAQRGAPSAKQLGYAMDTARERVGGTVPPVFQNAAMRTGTIQEPEARIAYETITGNMVQEVGFITTDDGRFGLSPDGLIDDDGVLEIKTMVSSATLFQAVANGDISEYVDQCNGYLWLLGRKWVDLCLWAPDLEALGLQLTIIRITRDEEVIESLEADLMEFSGLVSELESKLRSKAPAKEAAKVESQRLQIEATERTKAQAVERARADAEIAAATKASADAIAKAQERQFEELERSEIARIAKLNSTLLVEAAPGSPPTLRLGQICERLGFTLTADFMRQLGFEPAATDKAAKLYHENEFPRMCAALVRHIQSVSQGIAA